jgi:ABC-2 type transport system permease protein
LSVAAQYLALSRRSIMGTIRTPIAIVPPLVFPLIFLALNSAALDRSTQLPGFPEVDSFLQFMFATTIVQGTLFGSIGAGSAMATDIEGGFFERLMAAPTSRGSILIGRLAGVAAFAMFQSWFFFFVATPFGLHVEGGLPAMVAVSIVCAILAAGLGAVSMAFGLRTGSAEAVQGSFPLLFALMFLSSAFFPRTLMSGWFKAVADANPFSYLVEGLRHQVIQGFDLVEIGKAAGVAGGFFVLGLVLSGIALRNRLKERA